MPMGQTDMQWSSMSKVRQTHLFPLRKFYFKICFSEPVSMASVIGVVIALLVLFVILVIVLLYAYKKQKLCFKGEFCLLFLGRKKPLTFISVDCSVGFYMSHFLPSAKMSSLGNYRFPICFYCVCTFFIKRELICSWSYDHLPNPWLKIDNNERHNTEKKIHYSMMIESLP